MKMDPTICDPTLLNRFFDQELGPDEYALMSEHIKHCPSCQKALQDAEAISTLFRTGLDKELSHANLEKVEEKVLAFIRKKKTPWWLKFGRLLVARRFYVPATAVIAGLVLYFSFLAPPTSVSGPSAIINSFKGNVGSVMILETPKTHQTILWFSEPLISGDEDNGIEENQSTVSTYSKRLCLMS
ncbi:MAG: zf-HC2 domain-containing protein [Deltaproteobacteria bacterium]|nr:zf-HC2 domain-containing protein [Deltaproteobacteria bacterium]